MEKVNVEVKDIIFDYFNLITKEYEMSYEKWRTDESYQTRLKEIKEKVDLEFVEKRFEVPTTLTQSKTQEILTKKSNAVN